MQVKLSNHSVQIQYQMSIAKRAVAQCYQTKELTAEKVYRYGKQHRTIMELFELDFSISGISYLSHVHLIRHRHTTPFVQSQRYTETNNVILPYDLPDPMELNISGKERKRRQRLSDAFEQAYHEAYLIYYRLISAGATKEQARYFAPQGADINMNLHLNLRAFIEMYEKRTAKNVLAETRTIVEMMMDIISANEILGGFVK